MSSHNHLSSQPKPTPPNDEWEARKSIIHELYIGESKTLKEVQLILRGLGFDASKFHYEKKFNEWNFKKHQHRVTTETWKKIEHKIAKRKREGKESDVYIDGELVSPPKVKRETGRHWYKSWEKADRERTDAPSPPDSRARVTTPLQMHITLPNPSPTTNLPWLRFSALLDIMFCAQAGRSTKSQNQLSEGFTIASAANTYTTSPYVRLRDEQTTVSFAAKGGSTISDLLHKMNASLLTGPGGEKLFKVQAQSATLSKVSSHSLLSFLFYNISNNLSENRGFQDDFWDLIRASGVMQLPGVSTQQMMDQPTFAAMRQRLFEGAIRCRKPVDVITWVIKIGQSPNSPVSIKPASRVWTQSKGLHLPLVILMEDAAESRKDPGCEEEVKVIELLLSQGASIDAWCCDKHQTPIHCAIAGGRSGIIDALWKFIRSKPVKTTTRRDRSRDYFDSDILVTGKPHPVLGGDFGQERISLLSKVAHIAQNQLASLITPRKLMRAVQNGDCELLQFYHKLGARMDCHDDQGMFPLGVAVRYSHIYPRSLEVCRTLLDLGASPQYSPGSENSDGESEKGSALHYLLQNRHIKRARSDDILVTQICQLLVERGANIHERVIVNGKKTHSPLDFAIGSSNFDAIRFLCESGSRVRARHLRALYSNVERYHERFHTYGEEDMPPFDIVRNFAAKRRKSTHARGNIWTAVGFAARIGFISHVRMLVEMGAEVGLGALTDAVQTRHTIIAIYLLKVLARTIKNRHRKRFLGLRLSCAIQTGVAEWITSSIKIYKMTRSDEPDANDFLAEAFHTCDRQTIALILQSFPREYSSMALCTAIAALEHEDTWDFAEGMFNRRKIGPRNAIQEMEAFHISVGVSQRKKDFRAVTHLFQNEEFWMTPLDPDRPDALPGHQWLLVHYSSVSEGCLEMLRKSLLAGIDPGTLTGLLAAGHVKTEFLDLLISFGFKPNRRFSWSLTALQLAVKQENKDMVRLLLDKGADVNAPAPWKDSPETAQDLLWLKGRLCKSWTTKGLPLLEPATVNGDALQLAVESGNVELIEILIKAGANFNSPAARGRGATALQVACMKGYAHIVQILLSKGADMDAKGANISGRTALEGASEHGRLDIVHLLLERGCRTDNCFRLQYIRAVGFAEAEGHAVVASELKRMGLWRHEDDEVLKQKRLMDPDLMEGSDDFEVVRLSDCEEVETTHPFCYDAYEEGCWMRDDDNYDPSIFGQFYSYGLRALPRPQKLVMTQRDWFSDDEENWFRGDDSESSSIIDAESVQTLRDNVKHPPGDEDATGGPADTNDVWSSTERCQPKTQTQGNNALCDEVGVISATFDGTVEYSTNTIAQSAVPSISVLPAVATWTDEWMGFDYASAMGEDGLLTDGSHAGPTDATISGAPVDAQGAGTTDMDIADLSQWIDWDGTGYLEF